MLIASIIVGIGPQQTPLWPEASNNWDEDKAWAATYNLLCLSVQLLPVNFTQKHTEHTAQPAFDDHDHDHGIISPPLPMFSHVLLSFHWWIHCSAVTIPPDQILVAGATTQHTGITTLQQETAAAFCLCLHLVWECNMNKVFIFPYLLQEGRLD